MTADLPPDVRDAAAKAAQNMYWDGPEEKPWENVVDAVTAVVAPKIERPLQARIAELETLVIDTNTFSAKFERQSMELGAYKAWAERSPAFEANCECGRRLSVRTAATKEHDALSARVELLTAALTTVVAKNDLGGSGECAEYYGAKHPDNWCGACVARAAGETESEEKS